LFLFRWDGQKYPTELVVCHGRGPEDGKVSGLQTRGELDRERGLAKESIVNVTHAEGILSVQGKRPLATPPISNLERADEEAPREDKSIAQYIAIDIQANIGSAEVLVCRSCLTVDGLPEYINVLSCNWCQSCNNVFRLLL
jgi:hypothetical protein